MYFSCVCIKKMRTQAQAEIDFVEIEDGAR